MSKNSNFSISYVCNNCRRLRENARFFAVIKDLEIAFYCQKCITDLVFAKSKTYQWIIRPPKQFFNALDITSTDKLMFLKELYLSDMTNSALDFVYNSYDFLGKQMEEKKVHVKSVLHTFFTTM